MTTQQNAHAINDIVAATQALAPLIQESRNTMEAERRLPAPVVDALER